MMSGARINWTKARARVSIRGCGPRLYPAVNADRPGYVLVKKPSGVVQIARRRTVRHKDAIEVLR
jgi:hypothetical protein